MPSCGGPLLKDVFNTCLEAIMSHSTDERNVENLVTHKIPHIRDQRNEFKYEKLPAEHIRILQVTCEVEGSHHPSLTAHIRSFHITQLPHFIALSYAWPKPGSPSVTIKCNDQDLKLSTYVSIALQNLCPSSGSGSLAIWIDAICINQIDDEEKSDQVSRMGSIYSLASQAVVWVGENDLVDSHRAQIEALSRYIVSLPHSPRFDDYLRPPFPEYGHEVWRAVQSFKLSPWFRRLWVVQEVCLAVVVNVLCGHCCIPFESLFPLLQRRMSHYYQHDNRMEPAQDSLCTIDMCRKNARFLNPTDTAVDVDDVITSLSALTGQLVAKPIDRVFGLLFLLPEVVRQNIVVNYSQEDAYWTAYVDLGRNLLSQISGLSLLTHAGYENRKSQLPTWCPDWNRPDPVAVAPLSENMSTCRAQGGIERPTVRYCETSYRIQIKGFVIDTVSCFVRPRDQTLHSSQTKENPSRDTKTYAITWLEWQSQALSKLREIVGNSASSEEVLSRHVGNLRMSTWYLQGDDYEEVSIGSSDWPEILRCYHELIFQFETIVCGSAEHGGTLSERAARFLGHERPDPEHTYFFTRHGRIGRGHASVQSGDVLVVLYTAPSPFILRYEQGDHVATLIGDAYLEGCEYFETMPAEERGPDQWFTIG